MSLHHGSSRRGVLILLTALVPVALAAASWWLADSDLPDPGEYASAGDRSNQQDGHHSDEGSDDLTRSTNAPSRRPGDDGDRATPTATPSTDRGDESSPTSGPDPEAPDPDRRSDPDPTSDPAPQPTQPPPDPTDEPEPPEPPEPTPSEDPRPKPTGGHPTPTPTDDDDWPWPWLEHPA